MWIMSKASCFSLLIISFPRSAVTWSWFYILSDIFLYFKWMPIFLSHFYANLVPNPVMKLISEMCLKIFHRENLSNPLINLPASPGPASPMSLPWQTEGGALIPNWPTSETLLHFPHSPILPSLVSSEAFKANLKGQSEFRSQLHHFLAGYLISLCLSVAIGSWH